MDAKVRNQFEHEAAAPLRVANDSAGAAWWKGYADAYKGLDAYLPKTTATDYLRGYIAGLKARH